MPKLRVLVIVPLLEERDYFYETIKGRSGWSPPRTTRETMQFDFHEGDREAGVVVKTIAKMGHLDTILALNAAVVPFSPQLVILLGLAGSMDPHVVGLGDVVISNQVKIYAANKIGTISQDETQKPTYKFFPIPPPASVDNCIIVDDRDRVQAYSYMRYERDFVESTSVDHALSTLERRLTSGELSPVPNDMVPTNFRSYKSMNRNREIHYGWMFGSNHVVDSKEYRDYITEKNADDTFDIYKQLKELDKMRWKEGRLLAVDMESYGFLKAVETLRRLPASQGGSNVLVGGIVVRGVSDMAEAKAATDRNSKHEIRRISVGNAAKITAQIIERMDYRQIVV